MSIRWLWTLAAVWASTTVVAADRTAVDAAIRDALPEMAGAVIEPSPVPDISAVTVGTRVFYVTNDGRYVFGGPLIASADRSNLTEARVATARRDLLAARSDMPTFRYPADPATYRVTVFTDIDCPYCRRLHNDLPDYARAGIDVTYVMLPRSGKGSASYRKTVNAACAEDPEAAITAAMAGGEPPARSCEHPIDEHLALARQLNVSSTPSIVLPDGRLVLGHQPPGALLEAMQR